MHFVCGVDVEILRVEEKRVCGYVAWVAHPAPCDLARWPRELADLVKASVGNETALRSGVQTWVAAGLPYTMAKRYVKFNSWAEVFRTADSSIAFLSKYVPNEVAPPLTFVDAFGFLQRTFTLLKDMSLAAFRPVFGVELEAGWNTLWSSIPVTVRHTIHTWLMSIMAFAQKVWVVIQPSESVLRDFELAYPEHKGRISHDLADRAALVLYLFMCCWVIRLLRLIFHRPIDCVLSWILWPFASGWEILRFAWLNATMTDHEVVLKEEVPEEEDFGPRDAFVEQAVGNMDAQKCCIPSLHYAGSPGITGAKIPLTERRQLNNQGSHAAVAAPATVPKQSSSSCSSNGLGFRKPTSDLMIRKKKFPWQWVLRLIVLAGIGVITKRRKRLQM